MRKKKDGADTPKALRGKHAAKAEKAALFVTNDSLINLWDNEYDDQWNKY